MQRPGSLNHSNLLKQRNFYPKKLFKPRKKYFHPFEKTDHLGHQKTNIL